MIAQITKYKDFLLEKQKLSKIYKLWDFFPNNPFCNEFKYFIAFEFDLHLRKEFYNGVIRFLKTINQSDFTFYVLNPSAEDYYYKEFGVYGICVVPTNRTYREYLDFLNNPLSNECNGEDIELASNDIAYFSDDSRWCIYGARDWEIGIVIFQNEEIGNLFLDSYGEDKDIFLSLADRIQGMDEMFHFSEKIRKEYSVLQENYYSVFEDLPAVKIV